MCVSPAQPVPSPSPAGPSPSPARNDAPASAAAGAATPGTRAASTSTACPGPAGTAPAAPAPAPAAGGAAPLFTIDPRQMIAGLCGEEVRRRLGQAARHEETGRRVLAFYLVEMESRRLYQASGHGSTAHYAEARLGLDRRRTAELLRVGAKLLELRALDRALCDGRLCWSKVLIVARMASPEHEAAWLQRAFELDVRGLTLLAARSKEGHAPRAPGDQKGLPEIRFPWSASLSPLAHAKVEQVQRRLGDELGRPVDTAGMLDLLADLFLSTEADGSVPGRKRVDASEYRVHLLESGTRGEPLQVETEDGPLPVDGGGPGREGAKSEALRCDAGVRNHHVAGHPVTGKHVAGMHVAGQHASGAHGHDHRARDIQTPPRLRRRVLRRDGHRCRSCRSRWSLHVHHIEFRSHGGRTLFQNLITLCTRCHELVHANLLVIEGMSAEGARFVDAEGRPVSDAQQIAALEMLLVPEVLEVPVLSGTAAGVAPGAVGLPSGRAGAGMGAGGLVTLASLPAQVDATWWRRHAHLVRDRGEHGSLRFEAGSSREPQPPEVEPSAPRPEALDGLAGQEDRVARLRRVAEGARARGKPYPHVLLTGPAGTGKSTLARGLAAVAGQALVEVLAPQVTDRAAWVRLLVGLPEGSMLFLDEAHALPRPLLDGLLEALAERRLTLLLSDGETARRVTLQLPQFTLVAATTDEGAIPTALRSRFGLREILVHYGEEALTEVVRQAAAKQGAEATPEGARRLAKASRGTPREALRLLERVLDETRAAGAPRVDADGVERTLTWMGYDAEGLDPGEQRYVQVLRESPVPVALTRLAGMLGTSPRALTEHVEPWLFARGLVRMTPGGRTAGSYARLLGLERDVPHVRRAATRAYRTS